MVSSSRLSLSLALARLSLRNGAGAGGRSAGAVAVAAARTAAASTPLSQHRALNTSVGRSAPATESTSTSTSASNTIPPLGSKSSPATAKAGSSPASRSRARRTVAAPVPPPRTPRARTRTAARKLKAERRAAAIAARAELKANTVLDYSVGAGSAERVARMNIGDKWSTVVRWGTLLGSHHDGQERVHAPLLKLFLDNSQYLRYAPEWMRTVTDARPADDVVEHEFKMAREFTYVRARRWSPAAPPAGLYDGASFGSVEEWMDYHVHREREAIADEQRLLDEVNVRVTVEEHIRAEVRKELKSQRDIEVQAVGEGRDAASNAARDEIKRRFDERINDAVQARIKDEETYVQQTLRELHKAPDDGDSANDATLQNPYANAERERIEDRVLFRLWRTMSKEERDEAIVRASYTAVRSMGWRQGFSAGYPLARDHPEYTTQAEHVKLARGRNSDGSLTYEALNALDDLQKQSETLAWQDWLALTPEQRNDEEAATWAARDRALLFVDDSPDCRVLDRGLPRFYEVPQRVGNLVYLPNYRVRLVRNHTPLGQPYDCWKATFRVPLNLHKHLVRSYLLAVYGLQTTWIRSMIYRTPISRDPRTRALRTSSERTWKKIEVGLVEPFLFPEVGKEMIRAGMVGEGAAHEERQWYAARKGKEVDRWSENLEPADVAAAKERLAELLAQDRTELEVRLASVAHAQEEQSDLERRARAYEVDVGGKEEDAARSLFPGEDLSLEDKLAELDRLAEREVLLDGAPQPLGRRKNGYRDAKQREEGLTSPRTTGMPNSSGKSTGRSRRAARALKEAEQRLQRQVRAAARREALANAAAFAQGKPDGEPVELDGESVQRTPAAYDPAVNWADSQQEARLVPQGTPFYASASAGPKGPTASGLARGMVTRWTYPESTPESARAKARRERGVVHELPPEWTRAGKKDILHAVRVRELKRRAERIRQEGGAGLPKEKSRGGGGSGGSGEKE